MKHRHCLLAFVLAGCAADGVTAPAPAHPAPPPPSPRQAAAEAEQRQIDEAMRAQREAEAAAIKQSLAINEANQKMLADIETQRVRADEERVQKHRDACAATRAERVAEAQGLVIGYVDALKRIAPHLRDIRARCSIQDTRAVRVTKEGASSVRLQHVGQAAAVTCKGGLPKGLAEQDVGWALYRAEEGTVPAGGVSFLSTYETKFTAENASCRDLDKAAGFDSTVTETDTEGLKAIMRWRSPAATPSN